MNTETTETTESTESTETLKANTWTPPGFLRPISGALTLPIINEERGHVEGKIEALKRKQKEARRDLAKLNALRKLGRDVESEISSLEELLVDFEMEAQDLVLATNQIANLWIKFAQMAEQEREESEAEADEFDFTFPVDIDAQLAARLLGAMASNLQYALISGEPYYMRKRLQYLQSEAGVGKTFDPDGQIIDEEQSHQMITSERDDFNETELDRLTAERKLMRLYMLRLRKQYKELTTEHQHEYPFWPAFLNRTNEEVRAQVDEREAKRLEAWRQARKVKEDALRTTEAVEFRTIL